MSIHENCPRYWRGCFSCPYFMRDKIFFCRKSNRVRYGSDVVSVDDEREYKAEKKRTGGCWWAKKVPGGADN